MITVRTGVAVWGVTIISTCVSKLIPPFACARVSPIEQGRRCTGVPVHQGGFWPRRRRFVPGPPRVRLGRRQGV